MRDCEILLVEDNPDDVELTLLAFEESNLCENITVVRDGREAIDHLWGKPTDCQADLPDRRVGPPDATVEKNRLPSVVLLDLNLPKVSGLEVLRRIRADERTQCLPVIILTSSKEDEDIMNSYRLGANAYVRKPVDYDRFVDAAKTLGLFWLVLNEPPPNRTTCR